MSTWQSSDDSAHFGRQVKPGQGNASEACGDANHMRSVGDRPAAYHVPMAVFYPRHDLLKEVASLVLNQTPFLHNVVEQLPRLLHILQVLRTQRSTVHFC